MVSGQHIQFTLEPVHIPQSNKGVFSDKERSVTTSEIGTLLEKAVLKHTMNQVKLFHLFLFDGSHRMILNLTNLNKHVEYNHFKMGTLESDIGLLTPDCYMASIDLKDVYYSVPIAILLRHLQRKKQATSLHRSISGARTWSWREEIAVGTLMRGPKQIKAISCFYKRLSFCYKIQESVLFRVAKNEKSFMCQRLLLQSLRYLVTCLLQKFTTALLHSFLISWNETTLKLQEQLVVRS